MKEINESTIKKVVHRIYRDVMVSQSSEYFVKLTYTFKHFNTLITDQQVFHSVFSYLPNTNHRGKPFILSVAYNKNLNNYEVIVHNPRFKF